MEDCLLRKKLFGEKLVGYLARNENENDVIFSVGPNKVKVKALRVALKAACPAMERMFNEHWDTGISKNGEGILLPDVDPKAFEIFLMLLVADDWSTQDVEAMKLSTPTILNLVSLSKQFKMADMHALLLAFVEFNSTAEKFYKDFENFMDSNEFLGLSRDTLEAMLASNLIHSDEVAIFKNACKWADTQCDNLHVSKTGENKRQMLGHALYQIRFPLMSPDDFANLVCTNNKNILSELEEFQVLKYISLSEKNRKRYYTKILPFDTVARFKSPAQKNRLCEIVKGLAIMDEPSGVCDGSCKDIMFQVNKKILLESVGFLGPVEFDGLYNVIMELSHRKPPNHSWVSLAKVETRVEVKQKQRFHVKFPNPIELNATYLRNVFDDNVGYYRIHYYIRGFNTQTATMPKTNFRVESGGIAFFCSHSYNQLAEFRFKTC